jgi:hypothetical protein
MQRTLWLLGLLIFVPTLNAQQTSSAEPISDNSFLIEEAYNQEPGVVQHINTFMRMRGGDWMYTFTQEWPVTSMKHQLSFTFVGLNADHKRGLGDTAINYRYQLVDNDRVAVSPRVSVLLPTGKSTDGLGTGGVGIQTNLPVSVRVANKVVTHWNVGATMTPVTKNEAGDKAFTKGFNAGQSTIWLMNQRFNILVETAWNSYESVISKGHKETNYGLLVNPGVRWAHNFKSGLQIVPGISFPIGVGPSRGDRGVFFYLSFEHPFKKVTE